MMPCMCRFADCHFNHDKLVRCAHMFVHVEMWSHCLLECSFMWLEYVTVNSCSAAHLQAVTCWFCIVLCGFCAYVNMDACMC